jgi:hypothetical protein
MPRRGSPEGPDVDGRGDGSRLAIMAWRATFLGHGPVSATGLLLEASFLQEVGCGPSLRKIEDAIRRTVRNRAASGPIEEPTMSDKSPRQHMSKKQGKTIKEKRADKKGKAGAATSSDPVSRAAKR